MPVREGFRPYPIYYFVCGKAAKLLWTGEATQTFRGKSVCIDSQARISEADLAFLRVKRSPVFFSSAESSKDECLFP